MGPRPRTHGPDVSHFGRREPKWLKAQPRNTPMCPCARAPTYPEDPNSRDYDCQDESFNAPWNHGTMDPRPRTMGLCAHGVDGWMGGRVGGWLGGWVWVWVGGWVGGWGSE